MAKNHRVVGILGGGQLGRMLALAAHPLGLTPHCFDPAEDAPAKVASIFHRGRFDDHAALKEFANSCDVVTYEFENIALETAQTCAALRPLAPSLDALQISQDRTLEKQCFVDLKIPTAPFAIIRSEADAANALAKIGLPAVIKTARFGYDGKGQAVVRNSQEFSRALHSFAGKPVILEKLVTFDRELSIIGVASETQQYFYPLVENVHHQGILRVSHAPAPKVTDQTQHTAEDFLKKLFSKLHYRGVLVLELFDCNGSLVANEMAPRVHNSGHWSIEGAVTSQFENHLRAICGLPLGPAKPRARSVMFNIVGTSPEPSEVLKVPGAHLHLYGKSPRPGRKLGHVTLCETEGFDFEALSLQLKTLIDAGGGGAES